MNGKLFWDKQSGRLRTTLDIAMPREHAPAPSLAECRHAVLRIQAHEKIGFVVYDRLLSRIVDGVYFDALDDALGVADYYNSLPDGEEGPNTRSPNSNALDLIYPTPEA